MAEDPIIIKPYDKNWHRLFEQEKQQLLDNLTPWLKGSIEHVGSTAVVGLAAKPVIDIMVGIDSLKAAVPAIDVLEQYGYCYYPYKAEMMHWFCKPSPEIRTHHLHLVPFNSPLWHERIDFRDQLRKSPKLAQQYQKLKLELARKYKNDRELYTQNKWPFIKAVLDKTR